jgi:dihydropteroate synthase
MRHNSSNSPWLEGKLWQVAHGKKLEIGKFGRLMGVLNVTPDSFSDGGEFITLDAALNQTEKMIDEGADIIDIGGESTRPGAASIDGEEERRRILPIIRAVVNKFDVLISVDTYRAETAAAALKAGAHIVNDVWGLQKEPAIADVAKSYNAGLCIMHTGREREPLADVIEDQKHFFKKSLEIAKNANIEQSRIILDPGFGFAKNPQQITLLV